MATPEEEEAARKLQEQNAKGGASALDVIGGILTGGLSTTAGAVAGAANDANNRPRETEMYNPGTGGGAPIKPGQHPGMGVAGTPGGPGPAENGVRKATSETSAAGVAGWFGGKDEFNSFSPEQVADTTSAASRAAINNRIAKIDSRQVAQAQGAQATAATAGPVQLGAQNQNRSRQSSLADTLTRAMNGQGPSVAQQQLQNATDRNMKQALALQASARGVNPGLASRQAQEARASASQEAAGQSAILRSQEQIAARGELANVLNQSRGQDLSAAGLVQQTDLANAGFQQQTSLANAAATQQNNQFNVQAQMTQEQQRDQAIKDLQAQGIAVDEAALQRQIQQNQFAADLAARQEAARHGVAMQAGAQQAQAVAAGFQAAGTLLASDERVKKNVSDGEEPARKLLKRLRPKMFEYDDEHQHFGQGPRVGVMAQDVEKGAPELVGTDRDGVKKIDVAKALSAALAGLGSIDKRLSKLEGGRNARA